MLFILNILFFNGIYYQKVFERHFRVHVFKFQTKSFWTLQGLIYASEYICVFILHLQFLAVGSYTLNYGSFYMKQKKGQINLSEYRNFSTLKTLEYKGPTKNQEKKNFTKENDKNCFYHFPPNATVSRSVVSTIVTMLRLSRVAHTFTFPDTGNRSVPAKRKTKL